MFISLVYREICQWKNRGINTVYSPDAAANIRKVSRGNFRYNSVWVKLKDKPTGFLCEIFEDAFCQNVLT